MEKQIMPFKTTVNWLFNDMWCYLVITFFGWSFSTNSGKNLLFPEQLEDATAQMSGFSLIPMTNSSHMSWKYWNMMDYGKTKKSWMRLIEIRWIG